MENSLDHYYGSWPLPQGTCDTPDGTSTCDYSRGDVTAFKREKISQLDIAAEFEPGLCNASQSVVLLPGYPSADADPSAPGSARVGIT